MLVRRKVGNEALALVIRVFSESITQTRRLIYASQVNHTIGTLYLSEVGLELG